MPLAAVQSKEDFDLYWFARLHGDAVAYNALQAGWHVQPYQPGEGRRGRSSSKAERVACIMRFFVEPQPGAANYHDVLRLWNRGATSSAAGARVGVLTWRRPAPECGPQRRAAAAFVCGAGAAPAECEALAHMPISGRPAMNSTSSRAHA